MNIPRRNGFTIVELLIVIVVIAILAAISVAAYSGINSRSINAKINSDLNQIHRAILAARVNSGEVATRYITLSTATASNCVGAASTVDLADTVAAVSCWTSYNNAMDRISTASNINVRDMKDPWGRPYYLDENEKEGASQCGNGRDNIGAYPQPRTQGSWASTNTKQIPFITPGC